MKQILIAVEMDSLAQVLTDALEPSYHIVCCADGETALQMLYDLHPDVLVLDLMLSRIDGMTILQAAYTAGIHPAVVCISDYISQNNVATLERMNVRALFRTPMDLNIIIAKIFEVAESDGDLLSLELQIRNVLAMLGFKINANRYKLVERAIYEYALNPHQPLVVQLYPSVSTYCGGTSTQVEKAIRDYVHAAWQNRNDTIWRMYFRADKNGRVKKPTNAAFLACISGCIRFDNQDMEQSGNVCKLIG